MQRAFTLYNKLETQLPAEKRIKAPQNVGFPITDDEWKAIDALHPVIRTVRGAPWQGASASPALRSSACALRKPA